MSIQPAEMNFNAPGMEAVDADTHSDRQLFLFAFATLADVTQHVRMQGVPEEQDRLLAIHASWIDAQVAVRETIEMEAGIADANSLEPIPAEFSAQASAYEQDPLFRRTFADRPTQIVMVEIDKLVAAQRAINLEYVAGLTPRLPAADDLRGLLEFCVSPRRSLDPVQHLEIGANLHVFSSPNLDLRFLGSFFKTLALDEMESAIAGGLPAAAVVSFIGYGTAPINGILSKGRIILNNGLHRVYLLKVAGINRIPLVLQSSSNPALDFPTHIAGIPKEYLLGAPRPMLVADFFRPEFVLALRVRKRLKIVTLGVNIGQHDVPV